MELVVVAVVSMAIGLALGRSRWRPTASTGAEPAGSPIARVAPVDAGPHALVVERLVAALDGLGTGVVVVGPTGVEVHRNAAAHVSLAGTHAGVLIGDAVDRHVAQACRGERTEELLELYGPPKSVVIVRAVPAPGGGAVAFIDDISERRRLDAVRTDFVANISHELKTPVGALAVLAETLVDETDPVVIHRIAERMLDESHRASRTIDDLLELSRIELGAEVVFDGVDAADVVRGAVERTEALAEHRGIHVEVVDLDGPPPRFPGDRRQLVSAVGNLVENAVKYSEPGGRVRVGARAAGPWVEFEVSDDGVGIPARDLDRIFERFYRVDKARSRGTGGTGLGLAIVRHVATNHGGQVDVRSAEGKGSTFVLRVPLERRTAGPAGPVASAAQGGAT